MHHTHLVLLFHLSTLYHKARGFPIAKRLFLTFKTLIIIKKNRGSSVLKSSETLPIKGPQGTLLFACTFHYAIFTGQHLHFADFLQWLYPLQLLDFQPLILTLLPDHLRLLLQMARRLPEYYYFRHYGLLSFHY